MALYGLDCPGNKIKACLSVGQHRAVAVNVLPLEPQRLGLARAGVEQEAQRCDGDRMIRFRVVERPTERGKLVVRQGSAPRSPSCAAAVPCTGWSPRAAVRALPRASSSTTAPPATGSPIPRV